MTSSKERWTEELARERAISDSMPLSGKWGPRLTDREVTVACKKPSIWARVRTGYAYQEHGFPYVVAR